jgi:hypothetical protein
MILDQHTVIGVLFFGAILAACIIGYWTGHEPYDEQQSRKGGPKV